MSQDEGQGRAEALFTACVNAVDKHGVVDEVGMREAINTITAALRAERVKGERDTYLAVAKSTKAVAFLHGNDKWRERNALNEMAEWCEQQARRAGGL